MRSALALSLALALCVLAVAPARGEEVPDDELRAEVPALDTLHESIMPLWHGAWPDKDVPAMKGLVADLQAGVTAVADAKLPGILRDKAGVWQEGVTGLRSDMERYAKAAEGDDVQALLDAAEALHADFERLVRIVRPPFAELEAFHVVLYQLVHHTDLATAGDAARDLAGRLVTRCDALLTASLPNRVAPRSDEFRAAFTGLCDATSRLVTATEGGEAAVTSAALDTVHSRYQAAAALFE